MDDISVVCLIFCLFSLICVICSVSIKPTPIYANMDDPIILPCIVDNYARASWEGPCLTTSRCITNTTPYFDGLNRKLDLPNYITLKTSNDQRENRYDLFISKVSNESTGSYKCFRFDGILTKTKTFEVFFKVRPTNPVIENMTYDSIITGTENVSLDLVCTVTSGTPLETMTWITNRSIVAEGGPGKIRYSFIPTSESNSQTFDCTVNSDALEAPLTTTVQLDIKYQPILKCVDGPISVVEGNNFTVQCLADSNPSSTMVIIKRHGGVIKQCSQSSCSAELKSSRNDSGVYMCAAYNQIGNGTNCQTMVKILYPPVVSVVLLNDTTLHCSALGEPNNVSYLSWYHYSEQGKETHFDGSEYRELCSSCKRNVVNGVYRCSATNGIQDTDGNSVSFGNVSVQLKGTPEILPKTKTTQYGKHQKSVSLEIFVYSTTTITIRRISRNGEIIETSGRLATNGSFRNEHKVIHHIAVSQEADFANYTFEVKNDQGAINFTVSLVAKDVPEAPVIKCLTMKDSDITVHFNDTFDGGLPQVYVLQYKYILNWTSIEIIDIFDGAGSFTIQNLEVGQKYFFRIYSFNKLGKSNFSEVWSIELTGDLNSHVLSYVFIATGIAVLLFITTLISRKVDAIKTCLARSDNNGENDSIHDQQANVNRPRHADAQSHGDNSMQNRNLHYADLEFNPASQRFFIRGDDRTIYSEIDHSLVAPPLESSDSEEEDKKNEDEDVCMTVEEIAEFMRERGMKPPLDDD